MTQRSLHNLLARAAPIQQLGDYNAWNLELGPSAPVDMIWVSQAHDTEPLAHFVTPHGEPSIAIRRRRDAGCAYDSVDQIICGPSGKAGWYRPPPGEEVIAIRLKPEWSLKYFNILAGEYLNADNDTKMKTAKAISPNALRVAEKGSVFEIAQILLNDILAHDPGKINRFAPEAVAADMLRRSQGRTSIGAIADQLDISERHLRRRFQSAVGMSPKTYARQLRITAAAKHADETASPNWARIAADTGYFDQAHMIADFHALCGQTPVETHTARQALHRDAGSVFSNTNLKAA